MTPALASGHFGSMTLVSTEGALIELLGDGNCYNPIYLADLDQDGMDDILFDHYYHEGSYSELIRWVDGKPVRERLTGDGA
jgi:hypothetical protein